MQNCGSAFSQDAMVQDTWLLILPQNGGPCGENRQRKFRGGPDLKYPRVMKKTIYRYIHMYIYKSRLRLT